MGMVEKENKILFGSFKSILQNRLKILIILIIIVCIIPQILLYYLQHKSESCILKNQYKKAEKYLLGELFITKLSFGENDKDVTVLLNLLSDTYAQEGKYNQALKTIEIAQVYEDKNVQIDKTNSDKELANRVKDIKIRYLNKYNKNENINSETEDLLLTYISYSDYKDAEDFYNKAVKDQKILNPDNYVCIHEIPASLFIYLKNYKKAQKQLDLIIKNKNYDENFYPFINYDMARILIARKDYSKAEKLLEKAINVTEENYNNESSSNKFLSDYSPYVVHWEFDLIDLYILEHKYKNAEDYSQRMLSKIEKKDFNSKYVPAIYYRLALIQRQNKNYNKAVALYERGIKEEQNPENLGSVLLKLELGKLYINQKSYIRALNILNSNLYFIEKNKYYKTNSEVFPYEETYPYYYSAIESYKAFVEIYKSTNKPAFANYYRNRYLNNLHVYNKFNIRWF